MSLEGVLNNMKKFEYCTREFFDFNTIQEDELNELGQQGWELVAVENYSQDSCRFYFKREIK